MVASQTHGARAVAAAFPSGTPRRNSERLRQASAFQQSCGNFVVVRSGRTHGSPQPVPLPLLFPEEFGGEPVAGPTSIWTLAGFRSLQGVGKLGEKQHSSVHSLVLINVVTAKLSPVR